MTLTPQEVAQLRNALQDAAIKCSERCLYQSAKWAAELLNSLPETDTRDADGDADVDADYMSPVSPTNPDPEEAQLEAQEQGKYLLAKSFFDCKEYDRCAAVFIPETLLTAVLESHTGDADAEAMPKYNAKTEVPDVASSSRGPLPRMSQKSLFLALYAKYISGEKNRNEESEMIMGPQDMGSVINKQLLPVGRYLAAWFEERSSEDIEGSRTQGWLEYLYGMVLAKEKNDTQALEYLIRSVHKSPMNWGCWLEIASLISRVEDLNKVMRHCPQNITAYIFHVFMSLELYQQSSSLANSIEKLLDIFPTSSFLLGCNAMLSYHAKDLHTAERQFGQLLALHPYRLDLLDHYANILYILNLRPKLAFLAHVCTSVDKFRPESCVVIGNYYSLLSMHEKAVQFFRRALTLDRTCLSAWTLMGHEYVELKNTHAAIESYRRAVDVNRRDYRAWYGLGQAYEMLEMHAYSLWYYKKAAGIRPWDGKMWLAVGTCLQKMGRERDGIMALKRALLADTYYDTGTSLGSRRTLGGAPKPPGCMDPDILLQIAVMYDQINDQNEAKSYMELCVAQEMGSDGAPLDGSPSESFAMNNESHGGSEDGEGGTGVTRATSQARIWLARHAMRTADYVTANRLATELCNDGVEIEEAKALVREIRAIVDSTSVAQASAD